MCSDFSEKNGTWGKKRSLNSDFTKNNKFSNLNLDPFRTPGEKIMTASGKFGKFSTILYIFIFALILVDRSLFFFEKKSICLQLGALLDFTCDIIMKKYPKMAIWPQKFFPSIHARSTDIIMAIIVQIGQIRPLYLQFISLFILQFISLFILQFISLFINWTECEIYYISHPVQFIKKEMHIFLQ